MTDPRKLVSVVIPAYNEEDCVEEWLGDSKACSPRTRSTTSRSSSSRTGRSTRRGRSCSTIHERDARFKILRLARNFRMDGGLTAGLAYAKGDAAVLMTADLQDPPELITQFIAKWEEGYENVYGIVTARRGTGPDSAGSTRGCSTGWPAS